MVNLLWMSRMFRERTGWGLSFPAPVVSALPSTYSWWCLPTSGIEKIAFCPWFCGQVLSQDLPLDFWEHLGEKAYPSILLVLWVPLFASTVSSFSMLAWVKIHLLNTFLLPSSHNFLLGVILIDATDLLKVEEILTYSVPGVSLLFLLLLVFWNLSLFIFKSKTWHWVFPLILMTYILYLGFIELLKHVSL